MKGCFIDELKELLGQKYRILEKVGHGGSGNVYRAVDKTREVVALKVINSRYSEEKNVLRYLERELTAARSVTHQNVVNIRKIENFDGIYCVVMDFIEGENLATKIKRGELQDEEKSSITSDILMGLEAIHSKGIIHRDLKPSNIVINSFGRAIITDFGLAKSNEMSRLSRSGIYSGTPQYLAPEIWKGGDYSEQSDIYSLGVVLFELFYGELPFRSYGDYGYLNRHLNQKLKFPSSEDPANIKPVIRKALRKRRFFRYSNVKGVLSEIEKKYPSRLTTRMLIYLSTIITLLVLFISNPLGEVDKKTDCISLLIKPSVESGGVLMKRRGEILCNQMKENLKRIGNIKYLSESGLKTLKLDFEEKVHNADFKINVVLSGSPDRMFVHTRIGREINSNENYPIKTIVTKDFRPGLTEIGNEITRHLTNRIAYEAFGEESLKNYEVSKDSIHLKDRVRNFIEGKRLYGNFNIFANTHWYEDLIQFNPDLKDIFEKIDGTYPAKGVVETDLVEFNGEVNRTQRSTAGTYSKVLMLEMRPINSYAINRLLGKAYKVHQKYYKTNPITLDILSFYYISFHRWFTNIKLFKKYLLNSKNIGSLDKLIHSYFRLKDLDGAGSLLKNCDKMKFPKSYYRQLWQFYILKRELPKAEEMGNRVLYEESGSMESRRIQGLTYLWKQEFKKAEQQFEMLHNSSDYGSEKTYLLHKFILNQYRGNYWKAKKNLELLIELGTSFKKAKDVMYAISLLIRLEAYVGKFNGIPSKYNYSFEVDPGLVSYGEYYSLQGMAVLGYLKTDKIDKALKLFYKNMNLFGWEHYSQFDRLQKYLYEMISLKINKKGVSGYFEYFNKSYYGEADVWGENYHALFLEALSEAYRNEKRTSRQLGAYRNIQKLTFGALYYGDIYAKSFFECGEIYFKRREWVKAQREYSNFLGFWGEGDRDVYPAIERAEKRLQYIEKQLGSLNR